MKLNNKIRLVLQLLILVLVVVAVIRATDVEAYCPLGGFLSIGSRLVHGASSCQMSEIQMFLGVALVAGVLIIGKLFCSHICPIGTVTEWLGRWGRKWKVQIQKLPDWLDRGLRSLKYLLLLPVLYYTTTSSELFCKTFDPYFAATTGFGPDVIWYWALPALMVAVAGSLFLRQFWCKYLCPLAALSNLVLFATFSISTLIVYVILRYAGINLPVFWLFLLWVVGGFLWEAITIRWRPLPIIRLRRNAQTCIDCGLCDKVCPYDIAVSKADTVDHADCTMCVDCVTVCPVKNCLTLHRANWRPLPAFATVALISISLAFSSGYEISTLSERWGEKDAPVHLSSYETVVKSVKCFGTASGLKRKVERQKGIYGMDAYATSHKVVLYYNPEEIDLPGVKKAIFSPYKSRVRSFKGEMPESLSVIYLGVENLNDNVDNVNFARVLTQSPAVYGFESDYGEPVRVLIYFDASGVTPPEIVKIIETRQMEYQAPDGNRTELQLNFQVTRGPEMQGEINTLTYLQHIFNPFQQRFNEFKAVAADSLRILETVVPNLENPQVRRFLPYIASHLSRNDGIKGLETFFTRQPIAWIYYHPSQVDTTEILKLWQSPKMTVSFSSGEVKDFDNPFRVEKPFAIKTLDDVMKMQQDLRDKMAFLQVFQNSEADE